MLTTSALSAAIFLSAVSMLYAQPDDSKMKFSIADEASYNAYLEFYQYDRNLPLDAQSIEIKKEKNYTLEKITFRSTHDQLVPGLLALPENGERPFPCVLILHSASGKKEYMRNWMEVMAAAGYASLALDAHYHGERSHVGGYVNPKAMMAEGQWYRVRDFLVQTVIDYRRAMDYLETRGEIDSGRMAALGESMGGIINVPLSAVDTRIKTCVLVLAGAGIAPYKSQEMERALAPVSPLNFVSHISPRPLLMQNGRFDKVIPPEMAKALYGAAGEPKHIDWYDIGHGPEAGDYVGLTRANILKWLEKYL